MKGLIDVAAKATVAMRSPRLMFVGRPNLHTEILAQYLSSALYATCHFDHEPECSKTSDAESLVLIDCKYHDQDAIAGRLESLCQAEPSGRAVLFNATSASSVENLIYWPCLKGIFFEDCNRELLLKGMHRVLHGGIWMPRRLVEQSFERQRMAVPPKPRIEAKLSRREREILQCIVRAGSNADIATRLHISEHTVKSHIYNIFRKIGVRNRTEASHWAMLHLPSGK